MGGHQVLGAFVVLVVLVGAVALAGWRWASRTGSPARRRTTGGSAGTPTPDRAMQIYQAREPEWNTDGGPRPYMARMLPAKAGIDRDHQGRRPTAPADPGHGYVL